MEDFPGRERIPPGVFFQGEHLLWIQEEEREKEAVYRHRLRGSTRDRER